MKRSMSELRQITHAFTKELEAASRGKKTSLAFIRHTTPRTSLVKNNERFQVLVIGGSVYKSACMIKKGDEWSIEKVSQGQQPAFATAQDFLSFLKTMIDPQVHVVGLNFAYPLQPIFENGKLDGIFVSGGKEQTFTGLSGKKVGKEIEDVVGREMHVSVANDTICLLLSGLTRYPWDHLAAGIVGTGLNFALFTDAHTAINLESGAFHGFSQSEKGRMIDRQSTHPGHALFEKEVSGAYLYQHYQKAIRSTEVLDCLARRGDASAQALFEQSAVLVACQAAGITLWKGHDMTFIMEGSLFWKGWQYKETVEKYVGLLAPGCHASFVSVSDSAVLGAAKLVS